MFGISCFSSLLYSLFFHPSPPLSLSQYPELLVASYNNNEDAPHEPDGVALVWNIKFKKATPEYVFHCQVLGSSGSYTSYLQNYMMGVMIAGCGFGAVVPKSKLGWLQVWKGEKWTKLRSLVSLFASQNFISKSTVLLLLCHTLSGILAHPVIDSLFLFPTL